MKSHERTIHERAPISPCRDGPQKPLTRLTPRPCHPERSEGSFVSTGRCNVREAARNLMDSIRSCLNAGVGPRESARVSGRAFTRGGRGQGRTRPTRQDENSGHSTPQRTVAVVPSFSSGLVRCVRPCPRSNSWMVAPRVVIAFAGRLRRCSLHSRVETTSAFFVARRAGAFATRNVSGPADLRGNYGLKFGFALVSCGGIGVQKLLPKLGGFLLGK